MFPSPPLRYKATAAAGQLCSPPLAAEGGCRREGLESIQLVIVHAFLLQRVDEHAHIVASRARVTVRARTLCMFLGETAGANLAQAEAVVPTAHENRPALLP